MNRTAQERGFTLVEMLVAVAVLGLLVLMLSQVVGLSSQAIALNAKKLDATGQSRLVFDRLESDLAARPRRADLGMLLTKAAGNDSLVFYSGMVGYAGDRKMSRIGYRIGAGAGGGVMQLERGATGIDWKGGANAPLFLTQQVPAPAEADYEVLAKGVFRLEFTCLLSPSSSSSASVPARLSNAPQSDYSDVAALVVAIAVIDEKSRLILTDAQMKELASALGDCPEGQYPVSAWSDVVNRAGSVPGIPPLAMQGVHVYQRTFRVP